MALSPQRPRRRAVRPTVAPPEAPEDAFGHAFRAVIDGPAPGFASVPGYGPRDPEADDASVEHWEQARLWARLEFVVGAILTGALCQWPIVIVVLSGRFDVLGTVLLGYGVMILSGLVCLWVGTWLGLRPVLAWDESGLVLRHRPWRAPVRVTPGEVVWRPGSRYVGRYLFARPADRPPVRFPLWMIRRSGARRLFAYLDHADVVRE